jgi:hemerythrin superfamily protein
MTHAHTQTPTHAHTQTLTELHAPLHQAVIDTFLHFVATLTTLDLDDAHLAWASFQHTLSTHVLAEETQIFPAGAHIELPPKASIEILERDHALILQTSTKIQDLLQTLTSASIPSRRPILARSLDPLVRLHRTLEHHGQRENELLYPLLDLHLSLSERQRLLGILQNLQNNHASSPDLPFR